MTDKFPSAAYCAGQRARIAELEAELREACMQSLADLGQAQDAYEAQKKAEGERGRLKAEGERGRLKAEVDKAYREGWLDGYAKRPQRFPRAALGETEK